MTPLLSTGYFWGGFCLKLRLYSFLAGPVFKVVFTGKRFPNSLKGIFWFVLGMVDVPSQAASNSDRAAGRCRTPSAVSVTLTHRAPLQSSRIEERAPIPQRCFQLGGFVAVTKKRCEICIRQSFHKTPVDRKSITSVFSDQTDIHWRGSMGCILPCGDATSNPTPF